MFRLKPRIPFFICTMNHSFDVQHAVKYGQEEAVMIYHFQFWIGQNKANERHFNDGRYWTYNSLKAFSDLFPYWTAKQVRRIIDSLKEQGVIINGNYGKTTYDRTLWYAFKNEDEFIEKGKCICPNGQMDDTKRANGITQTGKCLTGNNHLINPDSKDDAHSEIPKGQMDDPKKEIPLESDEDAARANYEYELEKLIAKKDKDFRGAIEKTDLSREDFLKSFLQFCFQEGKSFSNTPASLKGLVALFDQHARFVNDNKIEVKPDHSHYEKIAESTIEYCRQNWKQVSKFHDQSWGKKKSGEDYPKEWFEKQRQAIVRGLTTARMTVNELKLIIAVFNHVFHPEFEYTFVYEDNRVWKEAVAMAYEIYKTSTKIGNIDGWQR